MPRRHSLLVTNRARRRPVKKAGESETCETRWYVSSHAPRAKALGRAIRKHWSIENGQHWVLDIAFGEDWRRQQARQGATNLAAIRRLAVSLLWQDKTLKWSQVQTNGLRPRPQLSAPCASSC
jgi:predicted transposase YbfD/YdcC